MTPDRRSQVGGLEFHADESALADALPRARDVESVALAPPRLRPLFNAGAMPQENRIERSASGGFIAFWRNLAIYQNGRMRKFATEEAARSFLARCDAAGKIVHET
jgi:hypothetical protein